MTHIVLINFSDQILQVEILYVEFLTGLLKLISHYVAATIFVEVRESSKKIIFPLHFVEVQRRSYEFSLIDWAAIIHIGLQIQINN